MEERRKSKRMELNSKLVIKPLNARETPEDAYIEIVDVSKTGIGFNCDTLLEIGTIYEAFLTIWTKEVIHAFVEVIRIEKRPNGFAYGAIFVGMPEMDSSRIQIYDTVTTMQNK